MSMGFACSMPIDRTDRVAIQLGHDTRTVGVGKCYHYEADLLLRFRR